MHSPLAAELTHRDRVRGDGWTGADVGDGVGAVLVGAEGAVGVDAAAGIVAIDDGVAGIDASENAAGPGPLVWAPPDTRTVLDTWPVLPLWLPADPQPPRARAAIMATITIDLFLVILASQPVAGMAVC